MFFSTAALFGVFGCEADGMNDGECTSSADCAPGFMCVDGTCELATQTPGLGGQTSDAGSSTGSDADSLPDAGRADTGSPGVDATVPPADGGGHPDANLPADAGGTCGIAACFASGAECGPIVDDCSTIVDCGDDCQPGFECGPPGGPFANRCRCDPLERQEACRDRCGDVDDGCGVPISCGGCGSNETCRNNRCECVPRSCSAVGAECGTVDVGCNQTRNCGSCDSPERCGGSGVPANQCGCVDQSRILPASGFRLFRSAQNNAGSGVDWVSLHEGIQRNTQGTNARLRGGRRDSDNRCSGTVTLQTDRLMLYNAGLNVPADATVTGIEVQIFVKRNGTSPRLRELYLATGQTRSSSKTTPNAASANRSFDLSTGYRHFRFGGRNDRWGLSPSELTPAFVNNRIFSARVSFEATLTCTDSHPFVDAGEVRVFYTLCR